MVSHISEMRQAQIGTLPELPEVETICRGLRPAIAGRTIVEAVVRRPDLRRPLQTDLAQRLIGAAVVGLHRRSKYILCTLSTGETLMLHLGMSGRIRVEVAPASRPEDDGMARPSFEKHDHVVLHFGGGVTLTFADHRRFGMIELIPTHALGSHAPLATLGPEPLGNGFSPDLLENRLRKRKAPIKNVLLDQRVVAGIGNIYASEALWRSGIAPELTAREISTPRVERLYRAIREVLHDAIAAGGSSLRDYRQSDGELGYFQHLFSVYGREGLECPTESCGGTILRIRQSGRSTFWCPICQS